MADPIKIIDSLIKDVKNVDIPNPGARTVNTRGTDLDICWFPKCPPGHTDYTWWGEEEDYEIVNVVEPKSSTAKANSNAEGKAKAKGKAKGKGKDGEAKERQNSKKQKQNQGKRPKGKNDAAPDTPLFARVDLRVGHVEKVFEHPNPDVKKLWCEQINVGEDKPRLIASGLRNFYSKEEFQGKNIIVVCNLKPSKLVGFVSNGMVLCASNSDHTKVELVEPPPNAKPGTRISLQNLDVNEFEPDEKINPRKKNSVWLQFAPKMATNGEKLATFDGVKLVTPEGDCTVPTLANCIVK